MELVVLKKKGNMVWGVPIKPGGKIATWLERHQGENRETAQKYIRYGSSPAVTVDSKSFCASWLMSIMKNGKV